MATGSSISQSPSQPLKGMSLWETFPPFKTLFSLSVCFISNHYAISKRKQDKMHVPTHNSQSLKWEGKERV